MEGAGAFQGGVEPMRAAPAEIDDRPALGGVHHAGGLRRRHALHVDLVHHEGLDELRLGNRRHDLQDGLVGEHRRSFRHGVEIAVEAELAEPG